ncbi:hypothetical protein SEEC0006_13630 [Salmonella enterica subsp. enterica serovar Choleraesuis str. 0006]|nr:hypothetical protein SEEC0006_13630 [Salmonella enterica subsp. enterica serovar Choleraesuis str. 0006]
MRQGGGAYPLLSAGKACEEQGGSVFVALPCNAKAAKPMTPMLRTSPCAEWAA